MYEYKQVAIMLITGVHNRNPCFSAYELQLMC